MEIIELLRLLQEGNSQLTAEQNAEALQALAKLSSKNSDFIIKVSETVSENHKDIEILQETVNIHFGLQVFIFLLVVLSFGIYMILTDRKLKRLEKLIVQNNEYGRK